MRVGIVSEYVRPWPGGISEHVHHQARELQRRGHDATVITGGPPLPHPEPNVLRLGRALTFTSNGARSRLALGAFVWRMRELLQELSFDVLHVHAPLDPVLPLTAALAAPCPVVGTFHASFERGALWEALYGDHNPLAVRAYERLAARIAVSEEARRSLAQYRPGEVTILGNGVDTERFAPAPRRGTRARPRILFVGRADPRKGLSLLLDAHARLLAQGVVTELVLCGVSARELPRGVAAREHVQALGYVAPEDLPRHYREADLCCSPALRGESQGVVLLEAMASGCPCVCLDVPGYREVIRHDETGWLVRERSAAALAFALRELLGDPSRREQLAANARASVQAHAWSRIGAELEGVLARACRPEARAAQRARFAEPAQATARAQLSLSSLRARSSRCSADT